VVRQRLPPLGFRILNPDDRCTPPPVRRYQTTLGLHQSFLSIRSIAKEGPNEVHITYDLPADDPEGVTLVLVIQPSASGRQRGTLLNATVRPCSCRRRCSPSTLTTESPFFSVDSCSTRTLTSARLSLGPCRPTTFRGSSATCSSSCGRRRSAALSRPACRNLPVHQLSPRYSTLSLPLAACRHLDPLTISRPFLLYRICRGNLGCLPSGRIDDAGTLAKGVRALVPVSGGLSRRPTRPRPTETRGSQTSAEQRQGGGGAIEFRRGRRLAARSHGRTVRLVIGIWACWLVCKDDRGGGQL